MGGKVRFRPHKIKEILALATELGYFPTYREMQELLGYSMPVMIKHRNVALQQWAGPMSANAKKTNHKTPVIVGVTAADVGDDRALLEAAFMMQDRHADMMRRKAEQSITLPDEPVAVAFLSDVHFGAPGTDYRTAFADAELVRDTPGMYAVFHGDGVDNFILGRLAQINMSREFTIDQEWRLLRLWVRTIGDKWLACVSGNHDAWTKKASGIDYLRGIMSEWGVLYDSDDAVFALNVGDAQHRVRVRHRWMGNSVFNPTHGIEVGWERAGIDYDIGVGGHTHRGTLIRPFVKHGRERFAVLTGAYKLSDAYGREMGFPPVHSTGAAALVLTPDGGLLPCPDLRVAARTLEAWRG